MPFKYTIDEKGAVAPAGYEGGSPDIDPAKEKKLVRKLDAHIIPVVMLLYLLSFLDRYVLISLRRILLSIG